MGVLGVTVLEVLGVVGLGALGFLVVILVCAGILAMLQVILPSTDSGALAADRGTQNAAHEAEREPTDVDTEAHPSDA